MRRKIIGIGKVYIVREFFIKTDNLFVYSFFVGHRKGIVIESKWIPSPSQIFLTVLLSPQKFNKGAVTKTKTFAPLMVSRVLKPNVSSRLPGPMSRHHKT